MLKSLQIDHLTVFGFQQADFCKGINVIVGDNGTGKTHLLKAGYSIMKACYDLQGISPPADAPEIATAVGRKLINVFGVSSIGRLVRRAQGRGRCEIKLRLGRGGENIDISFSTKDDSKITLERKPYVFSDRSPVFMPPRELISLMPGFSEAYKKYRLPFDDTWCDTCDLLNLPTLLGPRMEQQRKFLPPLEKAMGGRIDQRADGKFYLRIKQAHIEMHLVAEGHRKLAMLARLIMTDALSDKSTLFWDEPEANLNPTLIKTIARVIHELCAGGLQIILASHSVFLLQELWYLSKTSENPPPLRYFALEKTDVGVVINQTDDFDSLFPLVAADRMAEQAELFLAARL